jgi:hypothetical protein
MLTPLRNVQGTVVGVLGGSTELNAPGFLDHLQRARLGPAGGFQLISRASAWSSPPATRRCSTASCPRSEKMR